MQIDTSECPKSCCDLTRLDFVFLMSNAKVSLRSTTETYLALKRVHCRAYLLDCQTCVNKLKSAIVAATSSLSPKCGSSGPNNCEDGDKQDTTMRSSKFPTETRGWFLQRCFHEKLERKKSGKEKKKERIRKVCRSNEHFNVWLNKSTVFSEQRRERRGPWRICLGLRMEVKLSSKTMGFCVLLCHLYLRLFFFSYFSFFWPYI